METKKHPITTIKNCLIAQIITAVVFGIIIGVTHYLLTSQPKSDFSDLYVCYVLLWVLAVFLVIVTIICFIYVRGLMELLPMLDSVGKSAVAKLKDAAMINSISFAVATFGLFIVLIFPDINYGELQYIATLLLLLAPFGMIVAVVLNFIGYSKFRGCELLDQNGKKGAGQLLTAYIILIAIVIIVVILGIVEFNNLISESGIFWVSFINIIVGLIGIAAVVLYYVFTFGGWNKIRRSLDCQKDNMVS